MADLSYQMTFAGIPFVADRAKAIRLSVPLLEKQLQKHQPEEMLLDEIDRLFPFDWRQEFSYDLHAGRTLDNLARHVGRDVPPSCKLKVGQYYYPAGASRWSCFRGLATSAAVKVMLAATQNGRIAGQFYLNSEPIQEGKYLRTYGISTYLHMLPPRPLGEQAGIFDGLYLVTLVDERYKWQFTPASLQIKHGTSWDTLIDILADAVGVVMSTHSDIESAWTQPEPDSQLWVPNAPASMLLDAVAMSVGRTVVRNYDGSYKLYTYQESATLANASRKTSSGNVIRLRGGDSFESGLSLPVGHLGRVKEAVVPSVVRVHFPKYVTGDDPIPHYLNPRGQATRHYEDSYGGCYPINVPISQGGANLSGMSGNGVWSVQSTAKALYSGEDEAFANNAPTNTSGLEALAVVTAKAVYEQLSLTGLDESYLGILGWTPEGLHDILFTYSASDRISSTRVTRREWNAAARDVQNATPPMSGYSVSPIGQGGPPPTLTVREDTLFEFDAVLSGPLYSGDRFAVLSGTPTIPERPFKSFINNAERVLGKRGSGNTLEFIARGIDGTYEQNHLKGAPISGEPEQRSYLTNLITVESPLRMRLGAYTSGGVQEARIGGGFSSGDTVNITNVDIDIEQTVINYYDIDYNFYSGSVINYYDSINNYYSTLNLVYINLVGLSGVQSGVHLSGTPKLRIVAASGMEIHGFTSGMSGQLLVLWNAGSGAFRLENNSIVAQPGTRIRCPVGTSYVMWPNDGCIIEYDGTSGPDGPGRWRFDVPTVAGGNTIGASQSSGIIQYAARDFRAGSGLAAIRGTTDGEVVFMLSSGAVGSGGGGSPSFHGAKLFFDVAQPLAADTYTRLEWDVAYDTDEYFQPLSGDQFVTIPSDGYYLMGAQASFNATGTISKHLSLEIELTGATGANSGVTGTIARVDQPQAWNSSSEMADATTLNVVTIELLSSGDQIAVNAYSEIGGQDVEANDDWSPRFWITRLGV